MRWLDILVGTLLVFPLAANVIWFELPWLEPFELRDLAPVLLAVALLAQAVRAPTRGALAGAAALAAALCAWLSPWPWLRDVGPAAIVAAAALALRRGSAEPWESSFFFRQGRRLALAWLAALERSPARALWSAAAVAAALLLCVSLARHRAFASHGFDLGIFTNAMWNLTQGNGYVSSVKGGMNLFADHQSPLFWALAPFFWLAPRPETLLVAQALGLAAGGPALFYLARARFGARHWASAALPWLYWTYLPLRNANTFDFHPEVFMLPLFLWAFAAFASGRRWAMALGLLALAAALGAKESAPVVAAGIGVAWALTGAPGERPSRWWGLALAAAGVALFFFDLKIVPRFFGGEYAYLGPYQRFGGGIGDVLLAPFTQPGYFFSQLINEARLKFLFWTLAPLGFLPLFAWRAALAALPPYVMLFLAAGDQRVSTVFHYGIEPAVALFWALPLGLAAFAARFGWQRAGLWLLFWGVAAFGVGQATGNRLDAPWPNAALARELIACLDERAPLAASDQLIPHLATRPWVSYPDQLRQRPSGEPVACVVTDLTLGVNWPMGREAVQGLVAELPRQGYREVWRCREFSVHQLGGGAGCLRCAPQCP
jgi:uncharacterized membrane protein